MAQWQEWYAAGGGAWEYDELPEGDMDLDPLEAYAQVKIGRGGESERGEGGREWGGEGGRKRGRERVR